MKEEESDWESGRGEVGLEVSEMGRARARLEKKRRVVVESRVLVVGCMAM